MPSISVIVPVYNVEKYIDRCIKSILDQTYTDFELILVDDGSADKSGAICDSYAQKDGRIKVIHKENGGVSSARNVGICIAQGKYLTFIDSDDYVDSQFLEVAVRNISNHKVDMYISGITMELVENGKIVNSIKYNNKYSKKYSVKNLLENLYIDYPLICISGPCCKIYSKEIVDKNGFYFDESISRGEDCCFNFDIFSAIDTVYFENASYYHYYRENKNSLFSSFCLDLYTVTKQVCTKMLTLYEELNCCVLDYFKSNLACDLLSCIHNLYQNINLCTNKEIKDLIERIAQDEWVSNCNLNHIESKKNRLIIKLLQNKKVKIVKLIFDLWYLKKGYVNK